MMEILKFFGLVKNMSNGKPNDCGCCGNIIFNKLERSIYCKKCARHHITISAKVRIQTEKRLGF